MREVLGRERYSPFLCDFQGAVEVCTIPQRDGGHDKVERHRMEILFELCSIWYGAAAVKPYGAFERMVGFSLVESNRDTAAEFGILEPS
jgi:hypothetical protein